MQLNNFVQPGGLDPLRYQCTEYLIVQRQGGNVVQDDIKLYSSSLVARYRRSFDLGNLAPNGLGNASGIGLIC